MDLSSIPLMRPHYVIPLSSGSSNKIVKGVSYISGPARQVRRRDRHTVTEEEVEDNGMKKTLRVRPYCTEV